MNLDIEKIKAALEFYAASEWNKDYPGGISYRCKDITGLILDTGQKAKEALATLEAYDKAYSAATINSLSKRVYELDEELEKLHAKLEAYDPDAIRRECYWAAKLAVEESQYDGSGYYQVDFIALKAAIMNAGKE